MAGWCSCERGGGPSKWYCPRCGGEVTKLTPSIDPRYPLGRCKTNGKVALTADLAEAQRLAAKYQAELAAAREGA